MAKLQKYELDAVVKTVVDQIYQHHEGSPEQLEYEKQLKISQDLDKECAEASKLVVEKLLEEYTQKYPNMKFSIYEYYNRIDCEEPVKPRYSVSERDIEREIIVANISGDVQETISKLVTKYIK